MLSRAQLFEYLRAPLRNTQWSWGAIRQADQVLFLVVWQDESRVDSGRQYSLIYNQTYWGERTDSNGLNERQGHLVRARNGAKTYLIMALAEKPRAEGVPRRILAVNSDEVFEGGSLLDDPSGDVWIERRQRLPVGSVRPVSSS
jgi:hypothetical protein